MMLVYREATRADKPAIEELKTDFYIETGSTKAPREEVKEMVKDFETPIPAFILEEKQEIIGILQGEFQKKTNKIYLYAFYIKPGHRKKVNAKEFFRKGIAFFEKKYPQAASIVLRPYNIRRKKALERFYKMLGFQFHSEGIFMSKPATAARELQKTKNRAKPIGKRSRKKRFPMPRHLK